MDFLIREHSFLLANVRMSGLSPETKRRGPRREAGLPWLLADSLTPDTDSQLDCAGEAWGVGHAECGVLGVRLEINDYKMRKVPLFWN